MPKIYLKTLKTLFLAEILLLGIVLPAGAEIGSEVSMPARLEQGDVFHLKSINLIEYSKELFEANRTIQENGGRPLAKGTSETLPNLAPPLRFPRNFNRVSASDSNFCVVCNSKACAGAGGDIVANVFVTRQHLDFVTFEHADDIPTLGSSDEEDEFTQLQTVANSLNALGILGSGYIEMFGRHMTANLQEIRDAILPGEHAELTAKGVSFDILYTDKEGSWDFCAGTDPDDDGLANEINITGITAITPFQAQLSILRRIIPNDPQIEAAVSHSKETLKKISCISYHISELSLLENQGWIDIEPNPFNPLGNLQPGDASVYTINLNSNKLATSRLKIKQTVVMVPAFIDLKLHDITSGSGGPNREPMDQNALGESEAFFAGNPHFMTRKLWSIVSAPPYFPPRAIYYPA